jgi:hypothetical protein
MVSEISIPVYSGFWQIQNIFKMAGISMSYFKDLLIVFYRRVLILSNVILMLVAFIISPISMPFSPWGLARFCARFLVLLFPWLSKNDHWVIGNRMSADGTREIIGTTDILSSKTSCGVP